MNGIASISSLWTGKSKHVYYTMIIYQPWDYLLQFGCHTISAANHCACLSLPKPHILSFNDKFRSLHTEQILSIITWALQLGGSIVPRNEHSIVPLPEIYLTYQISCSRTAISVFSSAKMAKKGEAFTSLRISSWTTFARTSTMSCINCCDMYFTLSAFLVFSRYSHPNDSQG